MLTLTFAAAALAALVAGILFLIQGSRAHGIGRLYAENRPLIRLDPERVPPHLRHLIPLAEKWGIGDDIIRNDYIDRVNDTAKRELHDAFYGPYEEITAWLNSFGDQPMSPEAEAFMYAQGALDEMGYYVLDEKAKGVEPPRTGPFYLLKPEVAGGWGPNIKVNRRTHPPVVTHLHYEFEGWLGDDLLTTFPEFLVTEGLAQALEQSALTGFQLAPVEISAGGMWEQLYDQRALPQCRWLKITAAAGEADLGRTGLAELVVSQKGLDFLRGFSLKHCEARPWTG